MVRLTSHDQVQLFSIVRVSCRKFEAALDVNRKGAHDSDSEILISFGVNIFFVFPFEGHALDVIEWLHTFLLLLDGVSIVNPDDIFCLHLSYHIFGCLLSFRLILHFKSIL